VKRFQTRKKAIQLLGLMAMVSVFVACRESTFDDNFDPRLIKEAFASWGFTNPTDYTYDSNVIEVSGNRAILKQVDTEHAGSDFASGTHVGTYLNGNNQITLLGQPTTTSTHVNAILPGKAANLAGYWRFEGDLLDSSGNGLDGAATSPTFSNESKIGAQSYLASADGSSNENIVITSNSDLGEGNTLSVSFWFKSTGASDDWGTFLKKSAGGANDRGWFIQRQASNSVICLRTDTDSSSGGSYGDQDCSITNIFDGGYHHVAIALNGGSKKMFIDGILIINGVYSVGAGFGDAAEPLHIMNYSNIREIAGVMDELAIWNTTLTDNEIIQLYQAQNSNFTELSASWTPKYANLVGYWKMDGNWQDSSGNGNHGTANGGVTFTSTAKVGSQAGFFDGTDDYASLGNYSSLDLGNSFTLMAWYRVDDLSTHREIISTDSLRYTMNLWTGTGEISFYGSGGTLSCGGAWKYGAGTSTSTIGVWTHATITYDGADLRIYKNGTEVYSTPCTGTPGATLGTYIGRNRASNWFDGSIDDVGIWNQAISASDVNLIYNRQKQKFAGHYESPIIDLGASNNWANLDPITSLPFFKELPGASGSESSADYSSVSTNLMTELVGLWHFNESIWNGTADEVRDSSGNDFHGYRVSGSSTPSQGGGFSRYANLDSDSSVSLGPVVLPDTLGDITVSTWVRLGNISGNTKNAFIFSREGLGRIWLLVTPTGRLTINSYFGPGCDFYLTSTDSFLDGRWHHVLMSFDRDGMESIYVDGRLQGQSSIASCSGSTWVATSPIRVDTNLNPASFDEFKGGVDELAMWNRALSATEILQLYRRGANRLKYQVRSCDDSACSGETWQGPDNTASTYFSELHNYTGIDASGNGSGAVQTSPLELSFADFNAAGLTISDNRYFQYRVIMESDDENNLCSGAPCMPELTSLTIGPTGRYYGGSPTISNNTGVSYSTLQSITLSSSGSCLPKYQLSKDGSNFYYWNGSAWIPATSGFTHSSFPGDITSNISSFASSIGAGNFFFKAFLLSDTSENCELNSVGILYNR